MSGGTLLIERTGPALVLTFSNPARRNAFTPDMRRAAAEAICNHADDADIRAIILRGDGEHFCAGADISAIDWSKPPSAENARQPLVELRTLVRWIAAGPKPAIAAVEGVAAGAGLSFALLCDHVVVTPKTRMVPAFGRSGLIPDGGMLWALSSRVGTAKARRILIEDIEHAGDAAVAAGLADSIAEPGQTLEAALAVAERLAKVPPHVAMLLKRGFAKGFASLDQALDVEAELVVDGVEHNRARLTAK